MCRRTTRDPLLRTLLERYHLHLLAIPRSAVDVGDLYVATGAQVGAPGNMRHLLEPSFALPPVRRAEPMSDVSGRATGGVDANVGFELLADALAALGAGKFAAGVGSSFDAKSAKRVRFRFKEAVRDSVDILAFGQQLRGHRLVTDHPMITAKSRFYVVTGVARAASIGVAAETDADHALRLDVNALQLGKLPAGWRVAQVAASELEYSGPEPLAFGVELHELRYAHAAFALSIPRRPVLVRGAAEGADEAEAIDSSRPAWIGGHDGELLLRIDR